MMKIILFGYRTMLNDFRKPTNLAVVRFLVALAVDVEGRWEGFIVDYSTLVTIFPVTVFNAHLHVP